jgi:hypothetical protein
MLARTGTGNVISTVKSFMKSDFQSENDFSTVHISDLFRKSYFSSQNIDFFRVLKKSQSHGFGLDLGKKPGPIRVFAPL